MRKSYSAMSLWCLAVLAVLFVASTYIVYAGELVKEAKGECHYQCQDTNTIGEGITTCSPTNEALAAVENNHKDPLHIQCEQKQCGTASYSGSGGSGQESRCAEMPGMPPMLPMPMPMPKMPMPQQDECMDPIKADTKECRCKKPENADSSECIDEKTTTSLDLFTPEQELDTQPSTIVEYGKSLFDRLFGSGDDSTDSEEHVHPHEETTIRPVSEPNLDVVNQEEQYQSLQPPTTSASPSLGNTSENSIIPTNTFGDVQNFESRAEAAEAPGGIVSRIGAGAREILNNLRRFFGLSG